jgi:hypothetical protein
MVPVIEHVGPPLLLPLLELLLLPLLEPPLLPPAPELPLPPPLELLPPPLEPPFPPPELPFPPPLEPLELLLPPPPELPFPPPPELPLPPPLEPPFESPPSLRSEGEPGGGLFSELPPNGPPRGSPPPQAGTTAAAVPRTISCRLPTRSFAISTDLSRLEVFEVAPHVRCSTPARLVRCGSSMISRLKRRF